MLHLIIGGSGSGKSAFAEGLLERFSGPKLYLATMAARDPESLARIERHRLARNGKGFLTLERAVDLAGLCVPANAHILLEDLPNLLANELYDPRGGGSPAVRRGLTHLIECCDSLTVVSGDLFSGGSAYGEETLHFLRELAALHRELAERADLVAEIVCGLPNVLKGGIP